MKPVLIIKNIAHEGPGLLAELLEQLQIPSQTINFENNHPDLSLQTFSAVIVLGGPDSANDQNPKMENELDFVRQVLDLKIPYLGICLGMQVLVKAAGGEVLKSPVKEIGFFDPGGRPYEIRLTREGQKDPLFAGLQEPWPVFQLHGETVSLNEKVRLLGTSEICANQIVRAGENAYGIQCHFELTQVMFEDWLTKDADLIKMDHAELNRQFAQIKEAYTRTGKILFGNFFKNTAHLF